MIKVSIIGASGYAGIELVRLLALHAQAELVHLTSQSYAGQKIANIYPHLRGFIDKTFSEQDIEMIAHDSDVVFLALPHGHAVPFGDALIRAGKKVIDLGADFRFRDTDVYEKWYRTEHHQPELSREAVYGLPEVNRKKIKDAMIVGNPGCYPTSALLALYPLLESGLVDPETIIIDSKSGVSGAGRTPAVGSLYCECAESMKPYNVAKHRHTPEIEQSLSEWAGRDVMVSFTPHLVPMTRGILTTAYASLNHKGRETDILRRYQELYADEYFIRVLPEGTWPQTKAVAGTNFCDIGLVVDERTGRVVVSAAIDNLVKGAAGQAVQNMNLLFGQPEKTGLEIVPLYP